MDDRHTQLSESKWVSLKGNGKDRGEGSENHDWRVGVARRESTIRGEWVGSCISSSTNCCWDAGRCKFDDCGGASGVEARKSLGSESK